MIPVTPYSSELEEPAGAAKVRLIAEVRVPLRTVSESNQREHWATKHRRNVAQQNVVGLALLSTFGHRRPRPPLAIELTRFAPRSHLDPGNLEASFKHVQDAVAKFLGVDDGSPALAWSYLQCRGEKYAVRVRFSRLERTNTTTSQITVRANGLSREKSKPKGNNRHGV